MNKKFKLINKTEHDITLFHQDGTKELLVTEGSIRANVSSILIDNINGINVFKNSYEMSDTLPKIEGVYYIVSRLAAECLKGREDLLIVNETVRNEKGEIIGFKSFSKI